MRYYCTMESKEPLTSIKHPCSSTNVNTLKATHLQRTTPQCSQLDPHKREGLRELLQRASAQIQVHEVSDPILVDEGRYLQAQHGNSA